MEGKEKGKGEGKGKEKRERKARVGGSSSCLFGRGTGKERTGWRGGGKSTILGGSSGVGSGLDLSLKWSGYPGDIPDWQIIAPSKFFLPLYSRMVWILRSFCIIFFFHEKCH